MPGTNTAAPKRGRKKIDEAEIARLNEASANLGKARQAAKPKPNGKADTGPGKQTQVDAPKPAARRKAAKPADAAPGKQTQAGKAPPFVKGGDKAKGDKAAAGKPAAGKPAAKKGAAKKGAAKGGMGKQQQSGAGGSIGRQGAGAAGTEMRGGTKQVLISEIPLRSRGGRPRGEDAYPFADLTPAKKMPDGSIVGPSFFIPDSDKAKGKLAVARKRTRDDGLPSYYLSRKVREQVNGEGPEVPGLRIWLGTAEIKAIV